MRPHEGGSFSRPSFSIAIDVAYEGEVAPHVGRAFAQTLRELAPRVGADDRFPEGHGAAVTLGDTDDPTAFQAVEEQGGRASSAAAATVAAIDEELRDVQNVWIVGRRRAAGHEGEADRFPSCTDEKCESLLGLGPVEGQLGVTEAPVGARIDREASPGPW